LMSLAEPLEIAGNPLHIEASIGIALAPQQGVDGLELKRCADLAMYQAKAAGRHRYAFYQPEPEGSRA
jgi:GGDEF domain-containing protein